jgi:hypothetical protein
MSTESQDAEPREPVDESGEDKGPRVHTSADEGHPAGEGERSERDMGGPVAPEDAEETEGGAQGTRPTEGLDPHE